MSGSDVINGARFFVMMSSIVVYKITIRDCPFDLFNQENSDAANTDGNV